MQRMKQYLKPQDLDTEGCVRLAAAILTSQAEALADAARKYADNPNPANEQQLESVKRFYRSEYFAALSCGLVSGEAVAEQIIKEATGQ